MYNRNNRISIGFCWVLILGVIGVVYAFIGQGRIVGFYVKKFTAQCQQLDAAATALGRAANERPMDFVRHFGQSNQTYTNLANAQGLSANVLVDWWGRPVGMRYLPSHGNGLENESVFSLFVYSVGPNGLDDCGGGDDIRSLPQVIALPAPTPRIR